METGSLFLLRSRPGVPRFSFKGDHALGYFLVSLVVLAVVLVIAPFWIFPSQMEHYGTYLTGLAAISAALRFAAPYLLILLYRKRYSNELIWKKFLSLETPGAGGTVSETEWIGGLINYFRRNQDALPMSNPWYDQIPSLADDVYFKFGGTHLIGKKEDQLFEELKELLYKCAHLVAMNSTMDQPIRDREAYEALRSHFGELVKKADAMNQMLKDAPIPVKKMIEGNEFYRSFIEE